VEVERRDDGVADDRLPARLVELPFVSYGGSSVVSNFVMLALLLLVSHRAVRTAPT
jgi:cell division protein FtsW (lipid II flippase)